MPARASKAATLCWHGCGRVKAGGSASGTASSRLVAETPANITPRLLAWLEQLAGGGPLLVDWALIPPVIKSIIIALVVIKVLILQAARGGGVGVRWDG